MHYGAYDFASGVVRKNKLAFVSVVELGSFNVNGSARDLFLHATSYVGVDIRPGPGVDVVADAADFQPRDLVDVVVCMETLEHASNWQAINANAFAMLKPGGIYIVTAASPEREPHGVDGAAVGTEYYGNIDLLHLDANLRQIGFGFVSTSEHTRIGDIYAWAIKPEQADGKLAGLTAPVRQADIVVRS